MDEPHNGPDLDSNMLCLCPNHHLLFDKGGFGIRDDYSLAGIDGQLRVNLDHFIDLTNIRYHLDNICCGIFP